MDEVFFLVLTPSDLGKNEKVAIFGTFSVCVYWSKNWTKKLTPPPATDEDNLSPPH